MSRVLFICRRFSPGEAWANRLLAYAKGFAENGMNVCILFLITDEKRTPYTINIPNVEVINLWEDDGPVARIHRAISYVKNKRRIKDYIRNGDICFMTDATGLFIKEINQSHKNVKIVYEATEHPEVLTRGSKIKLNKLIHVLKSVDCIFAISNSIKQFFIDNGILGKNINIVNMFVDATRFENICKTESRKYIAYCGNVSYEKDGVDVLIRAFAKFHVNHPDYTLEIYGRSVGDSIERLKKLSVSLSVDSYITFTGMIDYNEIPQRLVNASILALARPNNLQNQNGFPTKLGEYLMTGNPVVVTSVGEIPIFIKDGYNGYLADPDSVESFAIKLEQASKDDSKNKEMSDRGKMLAMNQFSYFVQTQNALSFILENK